MKQCGKRNLSTVLTILVAVCICICAVGCGNSNSGKGCAKFREVTDGDFVYIDEGDYIRVCSLSATAGEKEEIIVPPFIKGKPVQSLCVNYYYAFTSCFYSSNMVKFYTPYTLKGIASDAGTVYEGENLQYVFYPSNNLINKLDRHQSAVSGGYTYFVTPIGYESLLENYSSEMEYKDIRPANVSYLFNYEDSPNDDYYFIDYAEGETLIRNAPAPEREGYRFVGWYKDSACTQAWDFETDTVPATEYDENEKEVYQETKLYAKWEEL